MTLTTMSRTQDALGRYLPIIKDIPPLPLEVELDLGRKIQALKAIHEDLAVPFESQNEEEQRIYQEAMAARKKLTTHNLRLVVSEAKRHTNHGVSLDDLVEFGNEGLLIAAWKYDPSKGWKFSTMALYWIRERIVHQKRSTARTIRVPVHAWKMRIATGNAEADLRNELGRTPTVKEVCSKAGLSVAQYKTNQKSFPSIYSLDYTTPDSDSPFIETVEDESLDEESQHDPDYDALPACLDRIRQIDRRIYFAVTNRLGFNGETFNYSDIGDRMGVSSVQVVRLIETGQNVLRSMLRYQEVANAC